MTTPPQLGRAKIRGEIITEAHAGGSVSLRSDWCCVVDEATNRCPDLSDHFETRVCWKETRPASGSNRAGWIELLSREVLFARDHPERHHELGALASEIAATAPGGPPRRDQREDPLAALLTLCYA